MVQINSLEDFGEVVANPPAWLRSWKRKTGNYIIGCFPMYVSEEILHAAGVLPVTLLGEDRPITSADVHLYSALCHPVRANFDVAIDGNLDYIDGLVIADICDQIRRLSNLWKLYHQFPFYHHLVLPQRVDSPLSKNFLVSELARLKRAVETFTRKTLSEADLIRSIKLYNTMRMLLQRLYQLRRDKPRLFKVKEIATIVVSAMLMPKEEFNPLLAEYLENKEKEQVRKEEGVRIILWGNPCEDIEPGFPELLDETGAVVVDDDFTVGARYFTPLVKEEGDPLENMADAQLNRLPCPTRHNPKETWSDRLLQVVKRTAARGVIVVIPKFCEIHAFEYPRLKAELSEAGIGVLLIESSHTGASGQIKTRVQAFIEILRTEG